MNEAQMKKRLAKMAEQAGGIAALGRDLGVPRETISGVINGRLSAPPSLLNAMGLVKVVRYAEAKGR